MRLLPRGVWHYAVLLIFLFALASVAAWSTVSYLYGHVLPGLTREELTEVVNIAAFKVWALTLGFMFMAGAFGLWAIRYSAELESRLRVSQVVEAMDYLNDGLLVVDKKGRIAGSNPSLKALVPGGMPPGAQLRGVFPVLTQEDATALLETDQPNEVHRDVASPNGRMTLRFRSQTAGGIRLILVSDVTSTRARELRDQQVARLHLIGRIARGVAYDFCNILSGISGHAALLTRFKSDGDERKRCLDAIARDAEKGAALAAHLLEFGHISAIGKPTDTLGEHVKRAGELVRVGLSSLWNIETTVEPDLPAVPLSGLQAEQVVLNLGLAAADALSGVGAVKIAAGRPNKSHLFDVGDDVAAVIVISAAKLPGGAAAAPADIALNGGAAIEQTGVIQSVVRSLLEQAGGSLNLFTGTDETRIYRILLPHASVEGRPEKSETITDEVKSYVSGWQVLLARATRTHDYVEDELRSLDVSVERVDNVVSALARVERGQGLHAIVVEKELLGDEADGLLKAMVKLCPRTGIVVLCEDPDLESADLSRDVAFMSRRSDPNKIVRTMVTARRLAMARRPKT